MKVVFIQPNIPKYRVAFYNALSQENGLVLKVHASKGKLGLLTSSDSEQQWASVKGEYKTLLGVDWQQNVIGLSLKNVDVLILCGNPRNLPILVLSIRARLKGVKCVWWGHFRSVSTKNWRAKIRYLLYKIPNNICFYSDSELAIAKKRLRHLSLNLFSISNGLDVDEIARYKEKYIGLMRTNRLIFVGRMIERSRLDLVINALVNIDDHSLKLDVVGDGPKRFDFERQVKKLDLCDSVTFHGAIVDEEQLSAIFNRASIFVSGDCVGLSLIHALAYGVPAIVNANRKTQGPEADVLLLADMALYHSGNSASIALQIKVLIDNATLRETFSIQALKILKAHHNTRVMSKRCMEMIKQL